MEDKFDYQADHCAGDDSNDPPTEEELEIESRKFIEYCHNVAREIRKQKEKKNERR